MSKSSFKQRVTQLKLWLEERKKKSNVEEKKGKKFSRSNYYKSKNRR